MLAPHWASIGSVLLKATAGERCHDVASRLAADSRTDITLGQMDVAVNSVPGSLEVSEVPTVYFKAASGFPFRYRGLRSSSALLELIKTKGKI